jgi:hypothetical protein
MTNFTLDDVAAALQRAHIDSHSKGNALYVPSDLGREFFKVVAKDGDYTIWGHIGKEILEHCPDMKEGAVIDEEFYRRDLICNSDDPFSQIMRYLVGGEFDHILTGTADLLIVQGYKIGRSPSSGSITVYTPDLQYDYLVSIDDEAADMYANVRIRTESEREVGYTIKEYDSYKCPISDPNLFPGLVAYLKGERYEVEPTSPFIKMMIKYQKESNEAKVK